MEKCRPLIMIYWNMTRTNAKNGVWAYKRECTAEFAPSKMHTFDCTAL